MGLIEANESLKNLMIVQVDYQEFLELMKEIPSILKNEANLYVKSNIIEMIFLHFTVKKFVITYLMIHSVT